MHRMSVFTYLLSLLLALGAGCDSAPERDTNPTVTDTDGDNLVAIYDCNDNDPSIGKCGEGDACKYPEQCAEGLSCDGGVCVGETCSDGAKNQDETFVDCGGGCVGCQNGLTCILPADCISGRCLDGICAEPCPDGFLGEYCDICADPKYTGTQCDVCKDSAFTGSECNVCADPEKTGPNCDLCMDSKFTGPYCTECADPLYFGPNCDMCVNQNTTGAFCDECISENKEAPDCNECLPQFAGATCEQCSNPRMAIPECTECLPPFSGEDCASCSNGWTGDDCDVCPPNWKGENCDTCAENWTGEECGICQSNWSGEDCDVCATHWEGDACEICPPNWVATEAGSNCDTCSNQWTGSACDVCPPNWGGQNCDECASNWAGENCDECSGGWTGEDCDICPDNWGGPNCSLCAKNWDGEECDVCSEGWIESDCSTYCGAIMTWESLTIEGDVHGDPTNESIVATLTDGETGPLDGAETGNKDYSIHFFSDWGGSRTLTIVLDEPSTVVSIRYFSSNNNAGFGVEPPVEFGVVLDPGKQGVVLGEELVPGWNTFDFPPVGNVSTVTIAFTKQSEHTSVSEIEVLRQVDGIEYCE